MLTIVANLAFRVAPDPLPIVMVEQAPPKLILDGVAFRRLKVLCVLVKSPPLQAMSPEVVTVVNVAAAGVVDPSAAGLAQSDPSSKSALRFVTLVVLAIVNGAVPVARVEVMIPLADRVVMLVAPVTDTVELNVAAPPTDNVPVAEMFVNDVDPGHVWL